ncbi:hypothetical protein VC83_08887 [Pseudogymnoascus destructans]|uniref:Uncharacterized protein n=1 Tax=Pseudogymnoascus destructans TaxID=655981 RepID=A0A177A1H1_9PEZI|nr:uncharacterized protein VC83_08887 [Pseudogymnoascus destructans]OAF54794.1 hypothetical protein VC83_08887 [Pseudogymnoascus destructans]
MSHQADMSHTSPPKRPRLSLQIKTPSAPMTLNESSTALKADIDPPSPTAFNTLSNAYAVAISPASPLPMSAAPTTTASFSANTARPKSLRLVASAAPQTALLPSHCIRTPGPFTVVYPDTPTTQAPTPVTAHPDVALQAPFTFKPPQSAHPSSPSSTSSTGTNATTATASRVRRINVSIPTTLAPSPFPSSPRTPRRATTGSSTPYKAPYTHPQSLRSILRNSPLPARTADAVATVEKGGRRVGYNDPLTQTITTELYVRPHVELLGEDDAGVDGEAEAEAETGIEAVLAYDGATRDGGQTPGPFEEMRRRMAGLGEEEVGGGRGRRRRRGRGFGLLGLGRRGGGRGDKETEGRRGGWRF